MASLRPQHQPRFDWAQAVAMYDDGFSCREIASELRVSTTAVQRVVLMSEEERRLLALRQSAMQKTACPFCGRLKTRRHPRCRVCANANLRAQQIKLVWVEDRWWPQLQCYRCREWKWMPEFPRNRNEVARGGRHLLCRPCQTVARREHRHRTGNP